MKAEVLLGLPPERLIPPGFEAVAEQVRPRLSERRFQHVVGVALIAGALAERFGVDRARATLAGLVHDIAREEPDERLRELAARDGFPLPPREANQMRELHAAAAVPLLREQLGLFDPELLEAVRRHTFGETTLSPLGAVLFIADKAEPRRHAPWPTLPDDFGPALTSLDDALLWAYDFVIRTHLAEGKAVDVRTVHARNRHLERLGRR